MPAYPEMPYQRYLKALMMGANPVTALTLLKPFQQGLAGEPEQPNPYMPTLEALQTPQSDTPAVQRYIAAGAAAFPAGLWDVARSAGSMHRSAISPFIFPEEQVIAERVKEQAAEAAAKAKTVAPAEVAGVPAGPPTADIKTDMMAPYRLPSDSGDIRGTSNLRAFRTPEGKLVFTNIEGAAETSAAPIDYASAVKEFSDQAATTSAPIAAPSGYTQMSQGGGVGTVSQSPLLPTSPGYEEEMTQRMFAEYSPQLKLEEAKEALRVARMSPTERAAEQGRSIAQSELSHQAAFEEFARRQVDATGLMQMLTEGIQKANPNMTPEQVKKQAELGYRDAVKTATQALWQQAQMANLPGTNPLTRYNQISQMADIPK